jgi:hypothetical protein
MKRIFMFLILIISFQFKISAINYKCNNLSDEFIKLYNNEDYRNLVNLFSYPPNQDSTTHFQDSIILSGLFSEMHRKWGKIESWKDSKLDTALYVNFNLCTDHSTYWDKQQMSDTIRIQIKFEKRDSLVLQFRIPKNDRKKIGYLDFDILCKKNPTQQDINEFKIRYKEMSEKIQLQFNELINQSIIENNNKSSLSK